MCLHKHRGADDDDGTRAGAAGSGGAGPLPAILSDEKHPLWWLNWPAILLIRLYQVSLSAFIGRSCRFRPTCSNFGLAAYRHHDPVRASLLTAGRVLRCNPLCEGGYDPVPAVRRRARGSGPA